MDKQDLVNGYMSFIGRGPYSPAKHALGMSKIFFLNAHIDMQCRSRGQTSVGVDVRGPCPYIFFPSKISPLAVKRTRQSLGL